MSASSEKELLSLPFALRKSTPSCSSRPAPSMLPRRELPLSLASVVLEVPGTGDCGLRLVEFTHKGRGVLFARACGDAQCHVFAIDFAGNRRAPAIDRQFA